MRIGRRSFSGIPKQTLSARRVTYTDNPYGDASQTSTSFSLSMCTVQPFIGSRIQLMNEGYREMIELVVFTQTEVKGNKQGTNQGGDEIFINGAWYKVLEVQPWQVGVIPHYYACCTRMEESLR